MKRIRRFFIAISLIIVLGVAALGGALSDRIFGYRLLDRFVPSANKDLSSSILDQRILSEESVVINVAEKVSPSVVTINASGVKETNLNFFQSPFFFNFPQERQQEQFEQDIATGFVVSADGLVVTNKHVVSDTTVKYKIITKDNKTFDVAKIYRDPSNDIAILKVNASGLSPIEMGDSSKLKVGQFVIAIGTALGEFRHTVTTGVISGIGRSITAGSPFEGSAEQLDDVIQTDAAINPGNSGGPLINSVGQVIGVNVAVSQEGQGIGFALPINLIKDSIENFNKTGQFSRPFLGIRYQLITQEVAIMNEVPQGAYLIEVVKNSPADKAGLQRRDIITKIEGKKINDTAGIAELINKKKVGESLELEIWRSGETKQVKVTLEEASQ